MGKNIKKSKDKWNVIALKALAQKHQFSMRYIKQCITGDRTPIFADNIKTEYFILKKKLDNFLSDERL
jgi:hypothetical protein